MNEEELKELLAYFRLFGYRDGEYMLPEEYEELENIIKRNKKAQEIEEARYQNIIGKLSDEDYQKLFDTYYNAFSKEFNKKHNIKKLY